MRTFRCPECRQPLAAYAEPPAGLPFATTIALVEAEQAARHHRRHCPGRVRDLIA